jgi:predicted dehydrogenase
MLGAVNKYKVVHQIGFNYRYAPAVQLMKRMIDEGRLGRIFHVRAQFLQDWIIDPDFPLVWRLDKKVCGSGSLGDLGAHFIDMARFLVGEFDSVAGMSKTFIKSRPLSDSMSGLSGRASVAEKDSARAEVEVDDATVFVAEFKNGALGVFEATRFAQGHKCGLSIEINGSKGSVKWEFKNMNELLYYNAEDEQGYQGFRLIQIDNSHPYMQTWWPTGHIIGYEHTFVHELYEFVRAVASSPLHNGKIDKVISSPLRRGGGEADGVVNLVVWITTPPYGHPSVEGNLYTDYIMCPVSYKLPISLSFLPQLPYRIPISILHRGQRNAQEPRNLSMLVSRYEVQQHHLSFIYVQFGEYLLDIDAVGCPYIRAPVTVAVVEHIRACIHFQGVQTDVFGNGVYPRPAVAARK